MPLRLYKLVVPVERIDAFVHYSMMLVKKELQEFTKPEGLRFFQSAKSPLTIFLKVWWKDPASAVQFDASPLSTKFVEGFQPYLAERLVHWDLFLVKDDYSPGVPVFYDRNVFLRLTKVSISPASSEKMIAMFDKYTNSVTRKQPGCLSVKLLKCTNVLDVYFIFTMWQKEEDFQNFTRIKEYQDIRNLSLDFLEKRLEIWSLNLLDSSDEVYKILGGVIDA